MGIFQLVFLSWFLALASWFYSNT